MFCRDVAKNNNLYICIYAYTTFINIAIMQLYTVYFIVLMVAYFSISSSFKLETILRGRFSFCISKTILESVTLAFSNSVTQT